MLKMFEGFKMETQNLLKVVQTFEDGQGKLATRIEDVKKENNKKIVTIINEVEKIANIAERKCNIEELNARMD